jgi:hypothetical protein
MQGQQLVPLCENLLGVEQRLAAHHEVGHIGFGIAPLRVPAT